MRKLLGCSVAALSLAAVPTAAFAAPIVGHIGFSGSVIYDTRGAAASGLSVVDFAPLGPAPGGTGTGSVAYVDTATGYFAGMPTFPGCGGVTCATSSSILDLTNDVTAAPPATFAPAGTTLAPFPIAGFLSGFTATALPALYTTLHFDLTEVLVAAGPACTGGEGIGDSCAAGPFTLEDTNEGVKIQFDVRGNFINGADSGYYGGSFSAVFNGLHFQSGANGSAGLFSRLDVTPQDLMCGISNLEGACSFSANFDPTNPVPEPATLLTLGTGAALAALRMRRKKNGRA